MKPSVKTKVIFAVFAVMFLTGIVLLIPLIKISIWPQYTELYTDDTGDVVIANCIPSYIRYNGRAYKLLHFINTKSVGDVIGKNDKIGTWENAEVFEINGVDADRAVALVLYEDPLI